LTRSNNTQDKEAGYNVKASSDGKQKTTYGFKAHIAIEEDGFIKASAFTAGNIHDSQWLAPLPSGTESSVYADRAYESEKHDAQKQRNHNTQAYAVWLSGYWVY